MIDEGARRGFRCLTAVTAAAQLGGASLVVNERRAARLFAQDAHHPVDRLARLDDHALGEICAVIARGVRGEEIDLVYAFVAKLAGQLWHGELAIDALAAGH